MKAWGMRTSILVAVVVAAGSGGRAVAQPAMPTPTPTPVPLPVPPSTGKEMPVADKPLISVEVANKALLAATAKASQKDKCDDVVLTMQTVLPYAAVSVDERKRALLAMQRCAITAKRWRAVILSTEQLLRIDPALASPDDEIRALVELGDIAGAIARGKKLSAMFPKSRNELTAAFTFMFCQQEAYAACVKAADAGLKLLVKNGVKPTAEPYVKNQIYSLVGLLGLGDFKRFDRQLAALQATFKAAGKADDGLQKLERAAAAAKARGMYVRVTPAKQLPLGVFHLKKPADAMLSVRVVNHTKKPRAFRVELEVPGITDKKIVTFVAPPGKVVDTKVQPTLKFDFKIDTVRAPRQAQMNIKLVEIAGGKIVGLADETPSVEVLPRDYLPTYRRVGADALQPTLENLGAWVTPNIKPVEEFLAKAKERAPGRKFVGMQNATLPQVAAIYDELKAMGVSYVMDPNVLSDTLHVQRTRLPVDVLKTTNAQCLEGTLLFATLLESIGLEPIIVMVPGHAFVGWFVTAKDKQRSPALFVETTMVGSFTFEQAVNVANKRVQDEFAQGNMESGVSKRIVLKDLRKAGVTPQPYE